MMYRSIALAFVAAIISCGFEVPDAENRVIYGHEAKQAVEAFGFSDVRLIGPAFYGCGRDYTIVAEWSGIGPRGHKVQGLVCGGIIEKGWSIKIWKVEPASAEK